MGEGVERSETDEVLKTMKYCKTIPSACHPERTTRVILSGVRLRTQSKPVGLPSVATVGSRVVKIDFLSMTRTKNREAKPMWDLGRDIL